jgi:hypothetical protein
MVNLSGFADGEYLFDTDLDVIKLGMEGIGVRRGVTGECAVTVLSGTTIAYANGEVRNLSAVRTITAGTIDLASLQDASLPKKVLIYVDDTDGLVKAVAGTAQRAIPAGSTGKGTKQPSPPDFSGSSALAIGDVVLAEIWLKPAGDTILSTDISDMRYLILPVDMDWVVDELTESETYLDALNTANITSQTRLDAMHSALRYTEGLTNPPINEWTGRRTNYVPVLANRMGTPEVPYPGISEVVRGDFVQEWLESVGTWTRNLPEQSTIVSCKAYDGTGLHWHDYATEIDSETVDDVIPFANGLTDDAIYFGFTSTSVQQLNIEVSTAGVNSGKGAAGWEWEYSQGGGVWADLPWTETNMGYGFTIVGNVDLTGDPPTDWALQTVDGQSRYWIRCRIYTGAYTSIPLLAYAHYRAYQTPTYTPLFDKFYIRNNLGLITPYYPPGAFDNAHGAIYLDGDDNFLWQVFGTGCRSTLEVWDEHTGTYIEGGFGMGYEFRPGHRRGVRITGIWATGNEQRLMDIGWDEDAAPGIPGEVCDWRVFEDGHFEKDIHLCVPTATEQGGNKGPGDPNGGNFICDGVGQTIDGRDVSQLILNNANPAVEQLTTKMVVIPDTVAVKNTTTNITVYGLTTISAANLSRKSAGCAIDVTYSFATNILSIVNPSVTTDVTYDILVFGV